MARYLIEIVVECDDNQNIKDFESYLEDVADEKFSIILENVEKID